MEDFLTECERPTVATEKPSKHNANLNSSQAQLQEPEASIDEQNIEFETFESPLQNIKVENGSLNIESDCAQGIKVSCSFVTRVDDIIDMSKYEIYSSEENCKIILTGNASNDAPQIFISFKTRESFERCVNALTPFRPHLKSTVQHNRRSPSNNPRRVGENSTVRLGVLRKLNRDQFQPQLATLGREVEISTITEWKKENKPTLRSASDEVSQTSEQNDRVHGESDEDRSSSGSEFDMGVLTLKEEDVDPTVIQEGRHARGKRNNKTVSLTIDQFHALQVKELLKKFIITRGATFNCVTLLEGDEVTKVNGQMSQTLHLENGRLEGSNASETVSITVRSCPSAICVSNIPNNIKGLGVTWNNTVVEDVTPGPLTHREIFQPLREGKFCLTHVSGRFVPFYTNREKIYKLLQNAGESVDLVFQPTERMCAVAGV